jgi:hypothetical protein
MKLKAFAVVKSREILFSVIPADPGSGLARTGYGVRHDDFETFYEIVSFINKRE